MFNLIKNKYFFVPMAKISHDVGVHSKTQKYAFQSQLLTAGPKCRPLFPSMATGATQKQEIKLSL